MGPVEAASRLGPVSGVERSGRAGKVAERLGPLGLREARQWDQAAHELDPVGQTVLLRCGGPAAVPPGLVADEPPGELGEFRLPPFAPERIVEGVETGQSPGAIAGVEIANGPLELLPPLGGPRALPVPAPEGVG